MSTRVTAPNCLLVPSQKTNLFDTFLTSFATNALSECHKYGINQRNFLLAPLAALFCTPLSKRLRLLVTIASKILAAPIGIVWLHAWLGPNKRIFQLGWYFYLSPLAVQKVTTPLKTVSNSASIWSSIYY